MGLRHVHGLIELKKRGFDTFELVALCDLQESALNHVAALAQKGLGKIPQTYTNFQRMLDREKGLDAVNIVTDTAAHHVCALLAFDEGKHVAVEKPLGLTVRACHRMVDGASRARRTLSVSENYRRDPMNRLVKALLQVGAIGEPRLIVMIATSGDVQHGTAWRYMKLRGGFGLERGVHFSDLIRYFMGSVQRVSAETHIFEKVRHTAEATGHLADFYRHRVKEEVDQSDSFEANAADSLLALLRFTSGAIGDLVLSQATHGQGVNIGIVYGSDGHLVIPASRTGNPVEVTLKGGKRPLGGDEVLALVPDFELDDLTSSFFDGERRLGRYQMPFEEIDKRLIAIELQDFGGAVINGLEPEVTGEIGLGDVALCYAVLESGYLGQPVGFDDVVEDKVNAYQAEINEFVALTT
jgi:predicted dehydrogenase